ncbi:thioredoxin family protein [Flammeovirga sp. SubArs3]|uniref:thioredoxin family protein n=1 Tax=Flammeovirga sp. SubArs3 TaxID=2995316 RepID=UPI00248BFE5B|nr:thioredoxin family protein [Flammeovirga sp. SubArs3]
MLFRTFCLLLVLSAQYSFSQGIKFQKISLEKAINEAKTNNKKVFIDIHTKWCPNCDWMQEEVFQNKKIGNHYNQNYICIDIDAESTQGIVLIKKYKLHVYPSFLYLDSDGNPIHLLTGVMNKDEFVKDTKEAENTSTQLFNLQKEIHTNKSQDLNVLSRYIYVSYKAGYADDKTLKEFLVKVDENSLKNKWVWMALKEATMYSGLHSDALQKLVQHTASIEKDYGIKDIIQTINAAANVSMQPFVEKRDIQGWEDLMAYLDKSLGKQGKTLNCAYNPTFYINIKEYSTAFSKMEQGVQLLSDRDPEVRAYLYRNWAWNIYHYYDDKDKLNMGLEWINISIKSHPYSINYETKAGLLFKLKQYKEARINAEKAIELAKKEKVHPTLAHLVLDELDGMK